MEKKIKVLIVGSDSSVKGGITSVIDRFLNYNWDGIEIKLLPTYIEGSKFNRMFFFLRGLIRYIKKLIKNDFDIAHIHMSYKGSFFRKYLIVKITKLFNKKIILHLHGSEFELFYNSSNEITKKMIKNIFENVDNVIVLGERWKNVVCRISPKCNINIFNNSVNVPEYKVEWNNGIFNIVFLGVLIKRKGIYDLIEAINLLNKSGIVKEKCMKFIIGGVGQEENNIKNKIREYELNNCVEMVGWVSGEEKEKLLKKANLFVLPSYNEGLPMAILEAMSYGVPVVATDVGSISEVVKSYKTGFLIKPGDYKEIVNSITDIVNNKELWITQSNLSKETIYYNFNEEIYFNNINDMYIDLYNKGMDKLDEFK